MVSAGPQRKQFTVYIEGGRYIVLEADEIRVDDVLKDGYKTDDKVLRLFSPANHQVAEFDVSSVVGWSEGNNPLQP